MWKDLIEFTKAVFSLQRDTQQNKDDIKKCERNIEILQQDVKDIRKEFSKLTVIVERLTFEIQRVSDRESTEREKMVLQLENETDFNFASNQSDGTNYAR